MAERPSFLHSEYIIDGIPQPLTPVDLLGECALEGALPPAPEGVPGVIADETLDIGPGDASFSEALIDRYARAVAALPKRPLPIPFAASFTSLRIAQALLDTLWMGGKFRLGDLSLKADWRWDDGPIGNMAAFYASTEAAGEYIDALGLRLQEVRVGSGACSVGFKAFLSGGEEPLEEEEALIRDLPGKTAQARLSRRRRCPATFLPEPSDWVIYIPFDTCDFRLGGSRLAAATGTRPVTALEIGNAAYFADCFEVVRELVEDGVVKAGATVSDGGLMQALQGMAAQGGADLSVGDLCKTYREYPVRVLFGEVPGVVIQIADIDYDYVDAELLLQDVAYFPLGHPAPGALRLSLESPGLSGILESLLNTLEGED